MTARRGSAGSGCRCVHWDGRDGFGGGLGPGVEPTPLNPAVRAGEAIPLRGDRIFVAAGGQRIPSCMGNRLCGIPDIVAVRPDAAVGREESEARPWARAVPFVRRDAVRAGCREYWPRRHGVREAGADPRQRSRGRCRRGSREGAAGYAPDNMLAATLATPLQPRPVGRLRPAWPEHVLRGSPPAPPSGSPFEPLMSGNPF